MLHTVKISKKTIQARATRRKIVESARSLFTESGFISTTIADIAKGAGVVTQTVYFVFGNKVSILQTVFDQAVSGDDEPIPILERPWVKDLANAKTPEQASQLLAVHSGAIAIRATPVYRVILTGAADPDVGNLLTENKRRRSDSFDYFVNLLVNAGLVDPEKSKLLADEFYLLFSEESYMLLVEERGWTQVEWTTWLEQRSTQLIRSAAH